MGAPRPDEPPITPMRGRMSVPLRRTFRRLAMTYRLATLLVGLAAVVAPQAASAATFYVDPAGSDANPGTSPLSPWRSVARVNSRVFAPGDSVLFRAGGVWNGMVSVQGGGTAAAPVTVGAYGGG